MNSELDRLYTELSSGQLNKEELKLLGGAFDKSSKQRGIKKRYFQSRVNQIFELVESFSASYSDILAALSKDGVDFDYVYFRKLMAKEKERRKALGIPPAPAQAPAGGRAVEIQPRTGLDIDGKPPIALTGKEALKAEIARIKTLNISSKERRDMITSATESYSKTINPLDRK